MNPPVLFEICVGSAQGAISAQEAGAHRVELCDNLVEGGTTPSAGAVQVARKHIDIGLNVIVRPRGGDFCYSDVEFETMLRDVETAAGGGADGIVIGLLNPDGSIDVERTGALIERIRPLPVTFHRAFDMASDPHRALEDLISLGVDRVLTSGQEISALEGIDLIVELIEKAAGRIVVMPGGGITERNVAKVVAGTGAIEIHVAAGSSVPSRMTYRNPNAFMGGELRPPEFSHDVTDVNRVKAFIQAVTTPIQPNRGKTEEVRR